MGRGFLFFEDEDALLGGRSSGDGSGGSSGGGFGLGDEDGLVSYYLS